MLAVRVIPAVLYDGMQAVRSVRFGRPLRNVGSLVNVVRVHQSRDVDELLLLDVGARARGQGPDLTMVEAIGRELFCPFAVGGGVRSLDDARALLRLGADRVAVGSAGATDVVPSISRVFGAQAVTVVVDARSPDEAAIATWQAAELGAGEIVVQAVDRDGTLAGPDLDMIGAAAHAADVPVVYAGGIATPADAVEAVRAGADAVAASSIFAYTEWTPSDLKRAMSEAGIPVRLVKGAA